MVALLSRCSLRMLEHDALANWRCATDPNIQAALPPVLGDWLQGRRSLTARIRNHAPDVAVRVLAEGLAEPRLGDELPDWAHTPCWVRCIALHGAGRDWIYARTVIPSWGPQNPWTTVQTLGTRPLGEILFTDEDLPRSPFEFARRTHWPHQAQWSGYQAHLQTPTWGRRCRFGRADAPLLLTEVFIAPASEWPIPQPES